MKEEEKMDMEPVERDPKKLYRTAFILLVVMVVGGIVILKAYEKRSKEGALDDRPSLLTKISEAKDLTFIRQDGEITNLMALKGKVLVVQSSPRSEADEVTSGIMQRLDERYAGNDDFALVTLMLDPGEADGLVEELQEKARSLGAELPKWTVGANERESLHKFIKNEFKASMLPYEREGRWFYDPSLVLIDKERHVRRAVVPQKRGGAAFVAKFDFEQAAQWDAEGIKTGTENSNVEQLEILLNDTIDRVLMEENDL